MKIDFFDLYWTCILGYILGFYLAVSLNVNDYYLMWIPIFLGLVPCLLTIFLSLKSNYLTAVWVPRMLILVVVLLGYLWKQITWRPFFITAKKLGAITKNRVYHPLIIDYGRNANEIKRVMHIEDLPITSAPNTFRELWYAFTHDKSCFQRACKAIFDVLPGTTAESYDLIWLMMISDNPHGNRLTKQQLRSLASASNKQLESLLPSQFSGAKDRASMIFSLMSGVITENYPGIRYSQVSKYSPELIYNLTVDSLILDEQGRYETVGPYSYLSRTRENGIETLLKDITEDNVESLAQKWGINLPGSNRISYLRAELSSYREVFARKAVPDFPDINGMTRSDAEKLLLQFTNKELYNYYEPRKPWNDRKELINIIYDDVNGDPYWSLTSLGHCCNDQTINILTGELHGDTNKHDALDPTLSYGSHKNYRCYQLSELVGSFDVRDGAFLFSVPDYTPGVNFAREFPIESIKQLKNLLESQNDPRYAELLAKIKHGLSTMSDAKQRIKILGDKFKLFTTEQQETCKLYLAWMFCYGMWMRFWKGPGYAWPVRGSGNIDPEIRDRHIIIQDMVKTRIVERYEKNPELKRWIEELPVIYIDLTSNEPATCASHTILSIMEQITAGSYCMGFGSDTIVKTAFYFITELLGHTEGKRFNDFISNYLTFLIELEQSVIDNIKCQDRYMTMAVESRLQEIQKGFEYQPGFTSYQFRGNRHT